MGAFIEYFSSSFHHIFKGLHFMVIVGTLYIICVQYAMQWATPFKIHTPPVENFGKCTMGSVNFQTHVPSVWFSI